MNPFFEVLTIAEAQARLKANWPQRPMPGEEVAFDEALDRVTALPVVAGEDVPAFDRSTVDGFAVRAADTFGASEGLPAFLTIVDDIKMGFVGETRLEAAETGRIATGGMLPPGADAVVMAEYTEAVDDDIVAVTTPVAPGQNIVRQGEDIKSGAQLIPAGHRLRPADIGALAAVGKTSVLVRQRPRVGIISTGDEIIPPETIPSLGQIRDINSYSLGAAVQKAGAKPVQLGLAEDEFEAVWSKVKAGLVNSDVVILSGGTSVGTQDVAAKVLAELGPPGVLVHGVALRPGKPLLVAVCQGKPVFGLPGHPVSALVTFDLFLRPAIERLLGLGQAPKPSLRARLTRNLASPSGQEELVRVRLVQTEDGLAAKPVLGKSGLITRLVEAQGTIIVPLEKEGLLAGTEVEVFLL